MTLLDDVPAGGATHTQHHRDVATAVDFLGPSSGTWTPAPTFLTPGTMTWTPDATYTWGRWQRIGDLVLLQFELYGTLNKGTASQGFRITGVPFANIGGDAFYATGPLHIAKGITLRGTQVELHYGTDDASRLIVKQAFPASGGVTTIASDFASGDITDFDLTGTIWYMAAPA